MGNIYLIFRHSQGQEHFTTFLWQYWHHPTQSPYCHSYAYWWGKSIFHGCYSPPNECCCCSYWLWCLQFLLKHSQQVKLYMTQSYSHIWWMLLQLYRLNVTKMLLSIALSTIIISTTTLCPCSQMLMGNENNDPRQGTLHLGSKKRLLVTILIRCLGPWVIADMELFARSTGSLWSTFQLNGTCNVFHSCCHNQWTSSCREDHRISAQSLDAK